MSEPENIVTTAKSRHAAALDHWGSIYKDAKGDLKFLSDDELAQWDEKLAKERRDAGLSCITLDKVDQTVHQVINNNRQNTPHISVVPDGDGGSKEDADAIRDIVRGIEYDSRADSAYDFAFENAVKARIGFIRVDHEYTNDHSFLQRLTIRRVINPLAVLLDPCSEEIDGSDANWCFVPEKVTLSEFKSRFPGKEPVPFDAPDAGKSVTKDDEQILIVEYFVLEKQRGEIFLLETGEVVDQLPEGVKELKKRTVDKTIVRRYRLSGIEVLEETTFPGKYIPLVPVYGKEAWEDGKRKLQSLISKVKPGARLHNLWASIETDMILRASRAPVTAPEGTTEPFIEDYKNPDKVPVLRYSQYDEQGRQLNAPTRLDPFPIPTGVVNARREAVDDIKASMGIYNASLGAQSNETSGVAIARRQAQGDMATFHYGDNLTKSVEHVGRIIVCAAPEIYDTDRQLLGIDAEDNQRLIGINGALAENQETTVNLTRGKYTVRVTTGPGYATKRQETVAALTDLFQARPEMVQIYADLYFANADFAGSDAMAERAKKMLPPQLKDEDEQNADPEKQALMGKVAELQQLLEQATREQNTKTAELQLKAQSEAASANNDRLKLEIEAINTRIKELEVTSKIELQRAELALKERDLDLKELELRTRNPVPVPQGTMTELGAVA